MHLYTKPLTLQILMQKIDENFVMQNVSVCGSSEPRQARDLPDERAKKQSTPQTSTDGKRCFNCGAKDHVGVSCPFKNKGTKFCPENDGTKKRSCNATQAGEKRYHKEVEIEDQKVVALIYTGSDLSLISYQPNKVREVGVKMRITLKDDIPVHQRPRRLSLKETAEIDKHIQTWLDDGIIRPSNSDYASPVVLVQKKDGATRLCIDYRKLNERIIKDRYPLPVIEDQIDKLQGAKVYSLIDLQNGFLHIIEHIKDGTVLTYLDNLIIPSMNHEDGLSRLKSVLHTASEHGLLLNIKKCKFLQARILYLGYIVENGTIMPSNEKTIAVERFPQPDSVKCVRSFLGLTVVDAFSKFSWFYPTKSTGTAEVIDRLKKQSVIFGNPRRIISDRGAAFTSHGFKDYSNEEGIQHTAIITGVPRGNGQVERVNRVLIPLLTKLSAPKPEEWFKHVPSAKQYLNNIPSRSTGVSPFFILTGTRMRIKDDPHIRELLETEVIAAYNERRDDLRQQAKENIAKIQAENKKQFNKRRKEAKTYQDGDFVAIKRTQFGTGLKFHFEIFRPLSHYKSITS
ncbi:PREDICTED: uncharacterized protein LOC107192452 [Dufourea novaeangliae]|uniref:uncharacterized protein LOC107192452 n=1 Tax=Dufourea novaeangliae TaxID=178035 RepID=UPI000767AA57|nr:PREDICTED: uncharacterized protein LOC107192452 [Dufourea novaeangliae]